MTTLTLTARLGLNLVQEKLVLRLKEDGSAPVLADALSLPADPAYPNSANPNASNQAQSGNIDYLAYYLLAKS